MSQAQEPSARDGSIVARLGGAAVLSLVSAVLLSGCGLREYVRNGFKVGPNYARPPAPTAPVWIDADDPRVRLDPATDCAWWTVFNDPVLNELVATAYRQNLDLRQAGTRVLEARALRNIAIGNLFPQTQSADITALQAQISQNLPIPFPEQFDLWTAGFNGSWELDVWGRYRRAVEAADAGLAGRVEDYGETLVVLLSDVAANYIRLRGYQQRLAYARANVEIQRGSLRLAEARFEQGASSELDLRQARANVSQTESQAPVFEAGVRESANALCVLMGMPPSDLAEMLGPAPIPRAPAEVALGIPADLLARRPDVRRAERKVALQSAELGVATTDLYPSLTLNGYVGYWAEDIDDLVRPDSFTGSFNPRFSWNLLNYGRIANNIAAHDARLEGAALEYQQTVLRAGQEVENALVRFLNAQRQAQALAASVVDAQRAVELARIQFEGGATDFNRVYTVQAFLSLQQDQLAVAEENIALSLVALYKALGGGWHCFLNCPVLPRISPAMVESVPAPTGEQLPPPLAGSAPRSEPVSAQVPAPPATGYASLPEPPATDASRPMATSAPILGPPPTGYASLPEPRVADASRPLATSAPIVGPPQTGYASLPETAAAEVASRPTATSVSLPRASAAAPPASKRAAIAGPPTGRPAAPSAQDSSRRPSFP